jgi:hypothetical protein
VELVFSDKSVLTSRLPGTYLFLDALAIDVTCRQFTSVAIIKHRHTTGYESNQPSFANTSFSYDRVFRGHTAYDRNWHHSGDPQYAA